MRTLFYVIAEPCVGVKDGSCAAVCPIPDCIQGDADSPQLYINPDECIGCGLCQTECPVDAIFASDELPEKWLSFTAKNAAYFGAV
jgi:ferredoxin